MKDLKFFGLCSSFCAIVVVSGVLIENSAVQQQIQPKQKDKELEPNPYCQE